MERQDSGRSQPRITELEADRLADILASGAVPRQSHVVPHSAVTLVMMADAMVVDDRVGDFGVGELLSGSCKPFISR